MFPKKHLQLSEVFCGCLWLLPKTKNTWEKAGMQAARERATLSQWPAVQKSFSCPTAQGAKHCTGELTITSPRFHIPATSVTHCWPCGHPILLVSQLGGSSTSLPFLSHLQWWHRTDFSCLPGSHPAALLWKLVKIRGKMQLAFSQAAQRKQKWRDQQQRWAPGVITEQCVSYLMFWGKHVFKRCCLSWTNELFLSCFAWSGLYQISCFLINCFFSALEGSVLLYHSPFLLW